jgi:hypothetical protein
MRRIPIATALLAALSLGAPSAALAHRHHHHIHASARHGHRHHLHARIERFSADSPATPGTAPSAPSANAGTVVSFEGGVLTLELANKSTVQGTVTEDTEISCEPAEVTEPTETGERSGGDDGDDAGEVGDDRHGEGFEGDSAGTMRSSDSARAAWSHGDGGDEAGDDDSERPESCGPAALVKGKGVRFAELRLTPSGSTFEKILLAP